MLKIKKNGRHNLFSRVTCVVFFSTGSEGAVACFLAVESDSGASVPSPEVFQDKKQRRPQDDDRRRKDQGPPVSNHGLYSLLFRHTSDNQKDDNFSYLTAWSISWVDIVVIWFVHLKGSVKNRTIASKMPPRFAKKQGSMSIEQPEETLSSNNLGTEIWETNSTGNTDYNRYQVYYYLKDWF